jgi:hypothetical protein
MKKLINIIKNLGKESHSKGDQSFPQCKKGPYSDPRLKSYVFYNNIYI